MADLLWMPAVLRAAGLRVIEIRGWQQRGHGAMGAVLGVLCHHTAGPATGNGPTVPGYPSETVVIRGRPGLDGPLCNLGLARDGTWVVVAAGQGWHAGTGSAPWCPTDQGNAHLIGVEAESVGSRDDWTPAQRESYPRGCAALVAHLGLGSWRVIGHKEWAPTRKIDPAFWDMNAFRAEVARWMAPRPPAPPPVPAPPAPNPTEDDVMFIRCQLTPGGPAAVALLSGPMFVGLGPTEAAAAEAEVKAGRAAALTVGVATWAALDQRSHALCDNPRPVVLTTPPRA